ncbi:hypothetical protein SISNIDRAFT_471816, partial [Sistotremastrum niveocremeum HHB9708]
MAPRDSANKNPRKPRKKKNIPVPLPDLDDLLPIDPTVPLYEERPSVPPGLLQMDSAAPVYQENPVTPPSHAASARQSAGQQEQRLGRPPGPYRSWDEAERAEARQRLKQWSQHTQHVKPPYRMATGAKELD